MDHDKLIKSGYKYNYPWKTSPDSDCSYSSYEKDYDEYIVIICIETNMAGGITTIKLISTSKLYLEEKKNFSSKIAPCLHFHATMLSHEDFVELESKFPEMFKQLDSWAIYGA